MVVKVENQKRFLEKGALTINYMNVFSNSKVNPLMVDFVKILNVENQNEVKYGDI